MPAKSGLRPSILHLYIKKLDHSNNRVNRVFTRLTVCIAQENRFKGKFYFSFCYRPNPVRGGVPEGEYPVTVPKQMLYGFGFTLTKKSIVVILNSHFH